MIDFIGMIIGFLIIMATVPADGFNGELSLGLFLNLVGWVLLVAHTIGFTCEMVKEGS